jgi:hypothetical protein
MKSRVLFLLALLAGSVDVLAQNLVPNGSFEEGSECPMFFDDLHFRCNNWYKSIQVPGVPMNENPSPDWYHECSDINDLTPPNTVYGYQEASDGDGFAGLINFDLINPNIREIMGIQLSESLQVGEVYFLTIKLATEFNALNSGIATNNFGFKLTTDPIFSTSSQAVNNFAHGFINEVVTDTSGWVEHSFQFIADSSYQYIHFGVFFTDDEVAVETLGDPNIARVAYMFIDDINLSDEPLLTENRANQDLIKIYPNPCQDQLNFTINSSIDYINIFTTQGGLVKKILIRKDEPSAYIGNLSKGLYIVQIVLRNGKNIFQTFIKI